MPRELESQSLVGVPPQEERALSAPEIDYVESEIDRALHRVEQIDAKRIAVAIEDKCVHLRGD